MPNFSEEFNKYRIQCFEVERHSVVDEIHDSTVRITTDSLPSI